MLKLLKTPIVAFSLQYITDIPDDFICNIIAINADYILLCMYPKWGEASELESDLWDIGIEAESNLMISMFENLLFHMASPINIMLSMWKQIVCSWRKIIF